MLTSPVKAQASAELDSPIGPVQVLACSTGVMQVHIGGQATVAEITGPADRAASRWAQEASRQLREYFHGRRRQFKLPMVRSGTIFQQQVWEQVGRIVYGQTCSYKEIAEKSGHPDAFRAVGSANGANPLPLLVPCHRVIAADGSLGGYSCGLDRKKWLLQLEKSVAKD